MSNWQKGEQMRRPCARLLFPHMPPGKGAARSCCSHLAATRGDSSEMAEEKEGNTSGFWWHKSWRNNCDVTYLGLLSNQVVDAHVG